MEHMTAAMRGWENAFISQQQMIASHTAMLRTLDRRNHYNPIHHAELIFKFFWHPHAWSLTVSGSSSSSSSSSSSRISSSSSSSRRRRRRRRSSSSSSRLTSYYYHHHKSNLTPPPTTARTMGKDIQPPSRHHAGIYHPISSSIT